MFHMLEAERDTKNFSYWKILVSLSASQNLRKGNSVLAGQVLGLLSRNYFIKFI